MLHIVDKGKRAILEVRDAEETSLSLWRDMVCFKASTHDPNSAKALPMSPTKRHTKKGFGHLVGHVWLTAPSTLADAGTHFPR
jgi:hypothetical protein